MELVDTHCHLQFDGFSGRIDDVIASAAEAQVRRLICVGTTLDDSRKALALAKNYDNVWGTIGVHPHDAGNFVKLVNKSSNLLDAIGNSPKLVAIGEIGLDYFKNYSQKADQKHALRLQIESGLGRNLPLIFHVRDAWEDFWTILDSYPAVKGVIHSFSATRKQLDEALERGLYIGLNGIMTFTKDSQQLEAAKRVPLDRLLLETDAPFLAPKPYRGQTCEPKHTAVTASFLAGLRDEPVEDLAKVSTDNAIKLFKLN